MSRSIKRFFWFFGSAAVAVTLAGVAFSLYALKDSSSSESPSSSASAPARPSTLLDERGRYYADLASPEAEAARRELAKVVSPEVIAAGGLKVFSTLDPELQESVGKLASEKRAAIILIENATGAIRASAGTDLPGPASAGSAFEPFVYAAAFDRGLLPGTLVKDERMAPLELPPFTSPWSPENADGKYLGPQPAAVGLTSSRRAMAVRVGLAAGLDRLREIVRATGLSAELPGNPASFLGAFRTDLPQLASAFTIFPNGGKFRTAHFITKVVNAKGEVVYDTKTAETEVIRPESAWLVTQCLQQGVLNAAAQLGWSTPAGGIRGTAPQAAGEWFVGYTTAFTCGVWQAGEQSALALWVHAMESVPAARAATATAFEPPSPLKRVVLCSASGEVAGTACASLHTSYVADLPADAVPLQACTLHPDASPTAPLLTNAVPAPAPLISPRPQESLPAARPELPPSSPTVALTGHPHPDGTATAAPAKSRTPSRVPRSAPSHLDEYDPETDAPPIAGRTARDSYPRQEVVHEEPPVEVRRAVPVKPEARRPKFRLFRDDDEDDTPRRKFRLFRDDDDD